MANVYDYPAVADLRDQAAALRAALIAILAPTAAEGHTGETTPEDAATAASINSAKWYDPNNHDLAHYIAQAAQSIGIDQVIDAAGYPDDVIKALADTINGQVDAVEDLAYYYTQCCYDPGDLDYSIPANALRQKQANIVFANDLPVGEDGTSPTSLQNCFRDCASLLGCASVLHWDNVLRCDYAFSGTGIIPESKVEVHLANCTNISNFEGNFIEITLVNARKVQAITNFLVGNVFCKILHGLNLAAVTTSQRTPFSQSMITIEFDGLTINNDDGAATWAGVTDFHCDADDANAVNYIRSGQVLGKTTTTLCQINSLENLDEETLLAMVYMAYDWGTQQDPHNPLGLTRLTAETDAMLTYDFTDDQKNALAAAYPDINVRQILENKGWSY